MKKTQFKDAVRNIWKQKVSWLSICIIALLGVASFISLCYASTAMKRNGSARYDEMSFRDIEVISTALLSPDDIAAIREVDGVADVEPIWQVNANVYIDSKPKNLNVITLTERINIPLLREGRLPERLGECAVEKRLADQFGWQVGDEIDWLEMTEASGTFFKDSESLRIVGIADHPDHTYVNVPDKLYVIVTKDAFDIEGMENCCMKAEVTVSEAEDADRFSEEHEAAVASVKDLLKELAPERTVIRDEQIRTKTIEELDRQQESLDAQIRDYESQRDAVQSAVDALTQQAAEIGALLDTMPADTEEYDETASQLAELESALEEQQTVLEQFASLDEAVKNAGEQLDEERAKANSRDPSAWLVFDERGNASFVQLRTGSENLYDLQMTFALLFVIIGALVIYATVSKMVDEQHTLVGTTKALGFFNREIMAKYLLFGVSATLLGMLLGVLVARFCMESIALNGYNDYFIIWFSQPILLMKPTLLVLLGGIALSAAAVWIACSRMIRTPAIRLMQPRAPKGRKKAARSGRHALSLYTRLILLNIRSDIKRVLVTIVSVAGCCALIVIGFTLKAAVGGCAKNQYDEIVDYDGKISSRFSEEIEDQLKTMDADYVALYNVNVTCQFDDTAAGELYCGDIPAVGELFHLYDWESEEPITDAADGVLIYRRLAEIYDLGEGSEFTMALNGVDSAKVRVAGVFENYLGCPIFMSREYFESLYGEPCGTNAFFVRFNGADKEAMLQQLEANEGFDSYTPADSDRSIFEAATSVIDSVVALFIFMAAVMAGVVMLNLTNIYIMQKKPELTIMRVNGFTVREVVGYVLRESVATTITGILLGIAVGAFAAHSIVLTLERYFTQFERNVCLPAWAYAAGITVVFSVIVNAIALRKVKNLKLTDIV